MATSHPTYILGGLGIRQASDLSLPAFLASTHGTEQRIASLQTSVMIDKDVLVEEAIDLWQEQADSDLPSEHLRGKQKVWDQLLTEKIHHDLVDSSTDPATKARLLSTATKEAGAWLNALPVSHLGTKLDNNSLRIAIGLRVGADLVEAHRCVCGAAVDRKGTHGLSCRRSGGRKPRHQAANETIRRALVSGGVPSVLEPVCVC